MSNTDDTKAVVSESPLLLGIDAGSTTIKLVVFDGRGKLLFSSYDKHSLNIKQTVVAALHHMRYILGDFEALVAITGSAGILLSELLGLPYIQEVVATKKAVEEFYPQADVVIELGGEDAKIIYLTGGVEQRMNSSCAGGTGGFLDLLSGTIGVRRGNFTTKAFGSATSYPIASRCAVFAQTDVRALLNQGAKQSDIIDSVYRAIVTQTISGLACGRPIEGTVVFLGGPFHYSKGLALRYQEMLGLTKQETIVPEEPHTFVARGAALFSKGKDSYLLSELERMISEADMDFDESVEYLTSLLPEGMTAERFRQEHPKCLARKMSKSVIPKDVFLGIDAGSTTVKMVLIDSNGDIITSRYERHRGEFIELTRKMLLDIYSHIPDGRLGEWYRSNLVRVVVTGYGEHALKVALRADDGIVETAAHLRASQELVGEVDSILDIGGQDIKYMRLVDGAIDDIVINEACSSGCGALIESFTKQFKSSRWQFAEDGLEARHPVDLGTRCTVFMTSRVRHAQKEGVLRGDISAGLAYSVVRNALYKVIGFSNLDAMGERIMVQGGTFMSDAVLAAFENITGKQAIRPDIAKSMGAYGAALTARDQYLAGAKQTEFLSCEEVNNLSFVQSHKHCGLCENNCMLTICKFNSKNSDEKPRTFITGNRCERLSRGGVSSNNLPNTFKFEQELLASYRDRRHIETRPNIGLTCARELFETLPFWATFVDSLGCNPVISSFSSTDQFRKGLAAIPAEGACYPSKLIFGQIAETIERGADVVFLPQIDAGFIYKHRADRSCPVASHYADVVVANPVAEDTPLITTDLIGLTLGFDDGEIAERLFKALENHIEGITYEGICNALEEARAEQGAFVDRLRDAAGCEGPAGRTVHRFRHAGGGGDIRWRAGG
ncbi:MAG: hypothetical protein HGA54_06765, partial [Actinobacteria bacterium]|nr:hypothetical protein [Actinomycetota bacterium]